MASALRHDATFAAFILLFLLLVIVIRRRVLIFNAQRSMAEAANAEHPTSNMQHRTEDRGPRTERKPAAAQALNTPKREGLFCRYRFRRTQRATSNPPIAMKAIDDGSGTTVGANDATVVAPPSMTDAKPDVNCVALVEMTNTVEVCPG